MRCDPALAARPARRRCRSGGCSSPASAATRGEIARRSSASRRPSGRSTTLDGETLSSTTSPDEPYVVNFWASWCVPPASTSIRCWPARTRVATRWRSSASSTRTIRTMRRRSSPGTATPATPTLVDDGRQPGDRLRRHGPAGELLRRRRRASSAPSSSVRSTDELMDRAAGHDRGRPMRPLGGCGRPRACWSRCVLVVILLRPALALTDAAARRGDRRGAALPGLRGPLGRRLADRVRREIRRQIDELVAVGATDDDVRDALRRPLRRVDPARRRTSPAAGSCRSPSLVLWRRSPSAAWLVRRRRTVGADVAPTTRSSVGGSTRRRRRSMPEIAPRSRSASPSPAPSCWRRCAPGARRCPTTIERDAARGPSSRRARGAA